MELGCKKTPWTQSGVGARIHSLALELGYNLALELGRKRTLPPGNNFKPEVWHKNNKALIKAGNLKGLLGYPTCKLVECISAILKIEDGKIS